LQQNNYYLLQQLLIFMLSCADRRTVLTATSGSAATWQASKGRRQVLQLEICNIERTEWVVVAATVNEAATLQMIGGVPT
jgi:hypothetical protein